jgi:hypothetical protein
MGSKELEHDDKEEDDESPEPSSSLKGKLKALAEAKQKVKKRKHDRTHSSDSSKSSKHTSGKLDFFQEASNELEKYELQEKYEQEIYELERTVNKLKREALDKDLKISSLQQKLDEREKFIQAITGPVPIPKELWMNWVSMTKMWNLTIE